MTFGNSSASRGWLAKASRVVEENGLDLLRGWVLLCEAVTLDDENPAAAAEKAREALHAARQSKDGRTIGARLDEAGAVA